MEYTPAERSSLNPCFSGSSYRSVFGEITNFTISLNPCFSGSSYRRMAFIPCATDMQKVLILVLVEVPIGEVPVALKGLPFDCLNPCFSGSSYRS